MLSTLRSQPIFSVWPIGLLLATLLVACSQAASTVTPEPAEPETVPTGFLPTEKAATAVPSPTHTPVPSPTAVPQPLIATADLNEPFALGGGTEIAVGEEGLILHFDSVLEDSRCPTDVDCFWSGQAIFLITATLDGEKPVELEFNTNPAPDQTVNELPAFGYTVQLIQLDPYPKTTDPISFADYQAQLFVTQNP